MWTDAPTKQFRAQLMDRCETLVGEGKKCLKMPKLNHKSGHHTLVARRRYFGGNMKYVNSECFEDTSSMNIFALL